MNNYKRLTERRGDLVIDNCRNCPNLHNPQGCIDATCYGIMKNRLAELEDKIEAGTLIEIPGIRKLNIGGMDCVEAVYIQHNGTIGECVCLNEAEAKKKLEELKNERI